MPKIRLAALDVDGTLVDGQKTLHEPVAEAVDALINAGIETVLCTGRSLSEVKRELARWPGIRRCILANGAYIADVPSGCHICSDTLSREDVAQILHALGEREIMPEIYSGNTVYSLSRCWYNAEYYRSGYLLRVHAGSRTLIEDMDVFCAPEAPLTQKIELSFHDPADIPHIQKALERLDVTVLLSVEGKLEIGRSGVCKGKALKALCEKLGIGRGQVAALGDSDSDVSMLEYAGLPVAMGNAAAAVKQRARFIVPGNEADGAAVAIYEHILG